MLTEDVLLLVITNITTVAFAIRREVTCENLSSLQKPVWRCSRCSLKKSIIAVDNEISISTR